MYGLPKLRLLWMAMATACLVPPCFGQLATSTGQDQIHIARAIEPAICSEPIPENGANSALRLVCTQDKLPVRNITIEKAIIIGFVGGFVRRDDIRHPEVQFAAHLRQAYPSEVHAEVFANHDGKRALHRVLQLLSEDADGVLTSRESKKTTIIIYGHSWGASQAVILARDLGRFGIPVSLAILVDSVHKPGHDDAVIPPNVRNAVNFYQTKGVIHGRSRIRAADPARTNIIGNFQLTYQDHQINCDNYPWIARHLNRGHHEIENDPRVWEQIALMIHSELFRGSSLAEASSVPVHSGWNKTNDEDGFAGSVIDKRQKEISKGQLR